MSRRSIALWLALAAAVPSLVYGISPQAESARTVLSGLIKKQQRSAVKESWGELDGQCFTWVDLDRFVHSGGPERIAKGLQNDANFRKAVAVLAALPNDEQAAVLDSLRKALRPTWAQQGRISPSGTTDAGQRAELLVADAIVRMAKSMIAVPPAAQPAGH